MVKQQKFDVREFSLSLPQSAITLKDSCFMFASKIITMKKIDLIFLSSQLIFRFLSSSLEKTTFPTILCLHNTSTLG